MTCKKAIFNTSHKAMKRANEINAKNIKTGDPTRLRAYICKECGYFHLTSMTKELFKAFGTPERRKRSRLKGLIRRESEYWENKLATKEIK